MTLAQYMEAAQLTDAAMARIVECDRSYISHIRKGRKALSLPMAIRLFNKTGHKFGPLAEATRKEIATIERVTGAAS